MTTPFSVNAIVDAASNGNALYIAAAAYLAAIGIQSMAKRYLPSADRRLIGRYMLIGMLVLLVMSIILGNLRSESPEQPHAMDSAFNNSGTYRLDLHGPYCINTQDHA